MFLRQKYPLINDITTNTADPVAFFAPASASGVSPDDMTYNSDFAAKQKSGYPLLAPLAVPSSPESVYSVALEIARNEMGWEVVGTDEESHKIQAIATTKLMKFKDDIVVSIVGTEEQSLVNMRSRSRVGRGDFGANAQRIDAFLKAVGNRF